MFLYISMAVLLGACYVQGAEDEIRNPICIEPYGYHPIQDDCDGYIQCKDYHADQMLCPDGLHFNPRAVYPDYPCSYPSEVTCEGRGAPQLAQPTAECPHQYGFFPSPIAPEHNCGQYRMCVQGQATEMMCADGLAFNPANIRCDWPDLVPTCDIEKYLHFTCPPAPLDKNGEPLQVVNYPNSEDCFSFYSCVNGRPRLLTCDTGYAFDAPSAQCVEIEKAQCAEPLNL